MRPNNGRLIALVAAVAVAAIAIGGALAYRQGPTNATQAEAAPLSGSPTPIPSGTTPTPTPTPKPSATPSATPTSTGPTTIKLNVSKLPQGRDPQVPYLVGREVLGGAGYKTKIPGTGGIVDIGRLSQASLAIVLKGDSGNDGTELLKIESDGSVSRRTPGVSSLVTTADQSAAAYAVAKISSMGAAVKGGAVYVETDGAMESLKLPDAWDLQVLAYASDKVYYRAGDKETGSWKLYTWAPGDAKPTLVKTVTSPTAVSDDGRIAASAALINDAGSCSSVVEVATGKQLFRTCENLVTGFTPDGGTAIGGPAYGDGYCDTAEAALDTRSGKLIREWKGCFHQVEAEDDQHLLLVAVASGGGGDPGTKSAIIRCTIATGACELATPISTDVPLRIGT